MARTVCESISPFLVMDILEKAQELEQAGHRVIHLEIGQPDFQTPECINEAAVRAIRDKKTAYTHSMGILPLREGIAEYYDREYGVSVSPEQVVVTNGTSPAMMLLFSVLCETGDTVVMPSPTYACYDSFVSFAGAGSLRVPSAETAGFQMNPQDVQNALQPNTRAILLNSPSNPAGSVISRSDMQRLAEIAEEYAGKYRTNSGTCPTDPGLMLVSDEIYHGLVYEGKATSALEVTDNCCVLDGFSKRYAMTGWRLGWMVVPKTLIPTLQVLQQNFFISPNSISQWAGVTALTCAGPDVERMGAEYNKRRLLLVERLRGLGFGIQSSPVGAFYVLADARHLVKTGEQPDSLKLAFDILEKAHVGVAPGIDFGAEAEGYLRFSYANSLENIEEAMHRLALYQERMQ